jgi:hypothetical protein
VNLGDKAMANELEEPAKTKDEVTDNSASSPPNTFDWDKEANSSFARASQSRENNAASAVLDNKFSIEGLDKDPPAKYKGKPSDGKVDSQEKPMSGVADDGKQNQKDSKETADKSTDQKDSAKGSTDKNEKKDPKEPAAEDNFNNYLKRVVKENEEPSLNGYLNRVAEENSPMNFSKQIDVSMNGTRNAGVTAEKLDEKSAEKANASSTEKSDDKAGVKPDEKSTEKAAEKEAEKGAQKATENSPAKIDFFPLTVGFELGAKPSKIPEGAKSAIKAVDELAKATDDIPGSKGIKELGAKAKLISEKSGKFDDSPSSMKELAKDLNELRELTKQLSSNDIASLSKGLAGKLVPKEIEMVTQPNSLVMDTMIKQMERGVVPAAQSMEAGKNPDVGKITMEQNLGGVRYRDFAHSLFETKNKEYALKPFFTPTVELGINGKQEKLPLEFPGAKMDLNTDISFSKVTSQFNSKTGEKVGPAEIVATVRNGNEHKEYTLRQNYNQIAGMTVGTSWEWVPRKK